MAVTVRPPGPVVAPLIEWRARRIEDPVDRLCFLQAAADRVSRPLLDAKYWKHISIRRIAPVVLWACVFVPAPVPSTVRTVLPLRASERPNSEDRLTAPVWLIEENASFEIYSNGLRIEKEFSVGNRPRGALAVFRRADPERPGVSEEAVATRSNPAGIVFHSTESHQAPFEPAETRNLKRLGRNLVEFVRQKKADHYVVDRFGRVYRVVAETDSANHAGRSIWADEKGSYIYLNDSFLGIALEAQSEAVETLGTAQVHSVRVLTEMLRAKYHISAYNCVTHAQVSVNPSNWRIGYHTDWAAGFPFAAIGLPDNYRLALASVTRFGFDYDDSFLNAAGERRWPGLLASLEEVRERAMVAGVPAADYKKQLQQRFQRIMNSAVMRERGEEQ